MELIKQVFWFGQQNPLISVGVVLVFLFLYSLVILRKRRAVVDALAAMAANYTEDDAPTPYSYMDKHRTRAKSSSVNISSATVSFYTFQLLFGFLWAVPVYFLWVPLIIIALPVTLAYAVVYPDKLAQLLSKSA